MEKKFNNEIVDTQYNKFMNSIANDTHSAYLAWINTLELFDSYVDEVRRLLDNNEPSMIDLMKQ